MGWAFGLVWDWRQGGGWDGRTDGRTAGGGALGKPGREGRGVHSEGVYRGYIWPLVLVNGGRGGGFPMRAPLSALVSCVLILSSLLLLAVFLSFDFVICSFFSLIFSFPCLSCFSHLFNLVCSRLWSRFSFSFRWRGGKKFCGKGLGRDGGLAGRRE